MFEEYLEPSVDMARLLSGYRIKFAFRDINRIFKQYANPWAVRTARNGIENYIPVDSCLIFSFKCHVVVDSDHSQCPKCSVAHRMSGMYYIHAD